MEGLNNTSVRSDNIPLRNVFAMLQQDDGAVERNAVNTVHNSKTDNLVHNEVGKIVYKLIVGFKPLSLAKPVAVQISRFYCTNYFQAKLDNLRNIR